MLNPSDRTPGDRSASNSSSKFDVLSLRDWVQAHEGTPIQLALRESRRFLSQDPWERGAAADAVGRLAVNSPEARSYLVQLVTSPEPSVRECTARALRCIALTDTQAERNLIWLMTDSIPAVARSAAWALLSIIAERCDAPLPASEHELSKVQGELAWNSDVVTEKGMRTLLSKAQDSSEKLVRLVAAID